MLSLKILGVLEVLEKSLNFTQTCLYEPLILESLLSWLISLLYEILLGGINFLLSSVFLVGSVLKYHGQILIKLDLPLLYINLISAGIY